MKTSEVLEKALERFGPNGVNWYQGWFHGPGLKVCSVGAIDEVTHSRLEDTPAMTAAITMLKQAVSYTGEGFGTDWNDKPGRTFAQVKAAFEKAIALARQEESHA